MPYEECCARRFRSRLLILGRRILGTGSSDAILYRILHIEPDTSAVPDLLRPMVEAALAKDARRRARGTNFWPG